MSVMQMKSPREISALLSLKAQMTPPAATQDTAHEGLKMVLDTIKITVAKRTAQ